MRTHTEIIEAAGGAAKLHGLLALEPKEIHAVRSWKQRDSIPPEYWRKISELDIASLDELAAAAEARRLGDRGEEDAAA